MENKKNWPLVSRGNYSGVQTRVLGGWVLHFRSCRPLTQVAILGNSRLYGWQEEDLV